MAPEDTRENIAQTVAAIMKDHAEITAIEAKLTGAVFETPYLVSVPQGRKVEDITATVQKALSFMRPIRRTGTDTLHSLQSLTDWANRFKGDGSVFFADQDRAGGKPSITCIANWHHEGAASVATDVGDDTARHADHRAVYAFPTSKEWQAWNAQSGEKMNSVEMGNFLEDRILDVLDPPPHFNSAADLTENDKRLIEIAAKIGTRYGTAQQLMTMAKDFVVNESSNFGLQRDNTSGEMRLMTVSEHKDADGKSIQVPGLFLIAIPVFDGGPAYRLPVRFQYRKQGATVVFFLTLHDPQRALDDAFNEAVETAKADTGIPVLRGKPHRPN